MTSFATGHEKYSDGRASVLASLFVSFPPQLGSGRIRGLARTLALPG